jgi:hypothetical protein
MMPPGATPQAVLAPKYVRPSHLDLTSSELLPQVMAASDALPAQLATLYEPDEPLQNPDSH